MKTNSIPKRPSCLFWSEIDKWTAMSSRLHFGKLPDGWRLLSVYKFAKQIDNKEKIDLEIRYRMAGVKLYGEGMFCRETVLGKQQSASYLYPLKPGSIIYNRLFAWKGSFAVVPKELDGFYVSKEFPQFNIDHDIVLPKYAYLLFISKKIISAVSSVSIGSAAVSRNRFKESDFLEFKIPVPPIPIQQKIVANWKATQDQVLSTQDVIDKIKVEFEKELLNTVGLQVSPTIKRKGKFTIKFSQNERWDTFFFRKDFVLLEKQIKFTRHISLGDALNFVSRSWKSDDFENGKFQYIEISSVTKNDGIISTKTVKTNNAPSRAVTRVKTGDLIISTTRPYLGAFTIIEEKYDGCVCSSGFALADSVKIDEIKKEFILLFLKSSAGLRQFERYMTGGLYPAIVQSELEKILLPIPPLEIQIRIMESNKKRQDQIYKMNCEIGKAKRDSVYTVEQMILGTHLV